MGPSVEGTWNVTPAETMPVPATVQVTFAKPDTGTALIKANSEMPGGLGTLKLEADVTGTWKIDGETMTWVAKDVKFKGGGMTDALAGPAKDMVKDNIGKNATGKMKWEGNDKFTVTTDSGKTATFERVNS